MCGHRVFKCVKKTLFFIDCSENEEIQYFKKPYKTLCVFNDFRFHKAKLLKYIGFYILLKIVKSQMSKKRYKT